MPLAIAPDLGLFRRLKTEHNRLVVSNLDMFHSPRQMVQQLRVFNQIGAVGELRIHPFNTSSFMLANQFDLIPRIFLLYAAVPRI